LFNQELGAVLPTLRNAEEKERLASWRGMDWTSYIAACLRNAGFREQGDLEERIHDVVVRLLVSPGGLFRGYDEGRHGSLDLRFKRSVANAVKNMAEKERNRRKYLPSGITAEYVPARSTPTHDPTLVERFRTMLQSRLGDLAVAILDARLDGRETKSVVGLPELNFPGRFAIKTAVQRIKALAREFAQTLDDPGFLERVERLMDAEAGTIARRKATTRQRAAMSDAT
jgi:hypothetical protein